MSARMHGRIFRQRTSVRLDNCEEVSDFEVVHLRSVDGTHPVLPIFCLLGSLTIKTVAGSKWIGTVKPPLLFLCYGEIVGNLQKLPGAHRAPMTKLFSHLLREECLPTLAIL